MTGREHYYSQTILPRNEIEIDDVTISNPIQQTIGVPQGPLLYNIATVDVRKVQTTDTVKLYIYADDMALTAISKKDIQEML